jgi:hypothetical protein
MEQPPGRINATRPTGRVSVLAQWEARRLWHAYLGPEHLLLGLPSRGAHAVRLLVEARGLTLEALRSAVDSELDRPA